MAEKNVQTTMQNGNAVEWKYPSPELASWSSDHRGRVWEALMPIHTFSSYLEGLDATAIQADTVSGILDALVERAAIMLEQADAD